MALACNANYLSHRATNRVEVQTHIVTEQANLMLIHLKLKSLLPFLQTLLGTVIYSFSIL